MTHAVNVYTKVMEVIRSLKKNFYSDQDQPPALQKLWTTIVFAFLILTEMVRL